MYTNIYVYMHNSYIGYVETERERERKRERERECGSSRRDTDVYSRHATRTTRIVFNSSTAAVIKGACGTTQFLHVPKRPKRILGRNDVYAAVAA